MEDLTLINEVTKGFCALCGIELLDESKECPDCGSLYCYDCASRLRISGKSSSCLCGSKNLTPSLKDKVSVVERILDIRRVLKQTLYRPVILLRRSGRVEEEFNRHKNHFLIPRELLNRIFYEITGVQNSILEEIPDYVDKIHGYYAMAVDHHISDPVLQKIDLRLNLLNDHLESFDVSVETRLKMSEHLIEAGDIICSQIETLKSYITSLKEKFNLLPGELGIGIFNDILMKKGRFTSQKVDVLVTTDRLILLKNEKNKFFRSTKEILEILRPEDVLEQKYVKNNKNDRAHLSIICLNQKIFFEQSSSILESLHDGLNLSKHGRPTEFNKRSFKLQRDWSSDDYQERVLKSLKLSQTAEFAKTGINEDREENQISSENSEKPEFLDELLKQRLTELRHRKTAVQSALVELKSGTRKIANRDYFDLLRQFELELAQIEEQITSIMVKSGLTNLMHNDYDFR